MGSMGQKEKKKKKRKKKKKGVPDKSDSLGHCFGRCYPGQRTRRAGHGQNQLTWAGKRNQLSLQREDHKAKVGGSATKPHPTGNYGHAYPPKQNLVGRTVRLNGLFWFFKILIPNITI